ncbi:MAG TPA: hypothetical protein ACFYEK_04520 [Candidatus Wunengus sp. YC60]|jgi:hypothetical protein|uniref:hypothetical protein n=1 Tax=Candidatus Wunengus sp. YC60 TaxID=3367697 RepID=UPI004026D3FF
MGNVKDINWHKACLKNFQLSIQRKQEEFDRFQNDLRQAYKDCDFYEKQILEAEKAHKDKFDRERYLAKRITLKQKNQCADK